MTDIYAGGVADKDGRVHVGDKIVTIDGNEVRDGQVEDAMALGKTVHALAILREGKKAAELKRAASKQNLERRPSVKAGPAPGGVAQGRAVRSRDEQRDGQIPCRDEQGRVHVARGAPLPLGAGALGGAGTRARCACT